jgi:hypothetical protein
MNNFAGNYDFFANSLLYNTQLKLKIAGEEEKTETISDEKVIPHPCQNS